MARHATKALTDWLTQARQENAERGPDAEWIAESDNPHFVAATAETWGDIGFVLWRLSDDHYVVTHDLTHDGDDWIVADFNPQ